MCAIRQPHIPYHQPGIIAPPNHHTQTYPPSSIPPNQNQTSCSCSAREQLSSQLQRLSFGGAPSRAASTYLAEGASVLGHMQSSDFLSSGQARRANVSSRGHSAQQHSGFYQVSLPLDQLAAWPCCHSGRLMALAALGGSKLPRKLL